MAGQTDPHISLFSPHDVEFMAEDEMVEIVPNMKTPQFHRWGLRSVRSSDSNANASVVAVALKRRGKCTHDKPEADADADTRSSSRQYLWSSLGIENINSIYPLELDSGVTSSLMKMCNCIRNPY
ncbi:hypothetical protein HID58_074238 [Brassica napus]|uniref:DNA replication complex GINS protein PSF2 N-terminal domain-containing protein n=1 Tax=Brassica napus TaxID=3708 RepID=A0ABQ7YG61_BRANA|nr:hypothetical protein HID58_074238 [Brassica napus]